MFNNLLEGGKSYYLMAPKDMSVDKWLVHVYIKRRL